MSSANKPEPGRADTTVWDRARGVIRTAKGGWVIGEAVHCHGYSLLDELVGQVSSMQVLLLDVTGRLPDRPLADWVEAFFNCVSWPDPRIWCNQVGSLGGTMQASPVAAVAAGVLASDSRMYGPGTLEACAVYLHGAQAEARLGKSPEALVAEFPRWNQEGTPKIPGFARPLAKGDERVAVLEALAQRLGFESGAFLELAYGIEGVLFRKHGEGINLTGYCTAFLLDQGYQPHEIYRISSVAVNAGVQACYAEAADAPPESFLPLRCADIEYRGAPPRPVPPPATDLPPAREK